MKKVVITCSESVSDKTYDHICRRFAELCGGELSFEKKVSKELVGGFTVAVDGKIYDMSIKTQMEMLKKHMNEG